MIETEIQIIPYLSSKRFILFVYLIAMNYLEVCSNVVLLLKYFKRSAKSDNLGQE